MGWSPPRHQGVPVLVDEIVAKLMRERETSSRRFAVLEPRGIAVDMEGPRAPLEQAVERVAVVVEAVGDPLRPNDRERINSQRLPAAHLLCQFRKQLLALLRQPRATSLHRSCPDALTLQLL